MVDRLELDDIVADVVRKDIKNVHLRVYPPTGTVRISAPLKMKLDTIRIFAISKIGWIRKQQQKLNDQECESRREYLDRESHYLWGKRYLLKVVEKNAAPVVKLNNSDMVLQIRPGATEAKRRSVVDEWYRQQVKEEASSLIEKWEREMEVSVENFIVRRMKTRWGSCTPDSCTIRLNLELAKKSLKCLEYVIVHELAHLLEPSHNSRFIALMDQFLPKWRFCRVELNRLPVKRDSGWK